MLFAMTTGSTLYGVENPKDEDIVVVVDKKSKIARCSTSGKDVFVHDIDEYKRGLFESPFSFGHELSAHMNNQAARENIRNAVLYGENPIKNVSLYDNKKLIFERVIKLGDMNFFNPSVRNQRGNHGCPKLMSWALWYYYAFENGSLELTAEQQNSIQLCHDGNLPIERAQELRKKILAMIEV